ncbi:MAG: hypothetical protein AAGC46_21290 [Solirubrobacteraceae bacterium]
MRRGLGRWSSRVVARLVVVVAFVGVAGWYVFGVLPADDAPPGPSSDTEAFISGDYADDVDGLLLTGRFSVDLLERGQVQERPGPQHVTANDAVAWARRRHADVIFIGSGNGQWVTGRSPSPSLELPRWPTGGIAFHERFVYEPISGPRPRAWWVRLSFNDDHVPPAPEIARLLAAPGRCLRVHVVDAGPKPDVDCLVGFDRRHSAFTDATTYAGAVPIPPRGPSWWDRLIHPRRTTFWTTDLGGGVGYELLGPVGQPRRAA